MKPFLITIIVGNAFGMVKASVEALTAVNNYHFEQFSTMAAVFFFGLLMGVSALIIRNKYGTE